MAKLQLNSRNLLICAIIITSMIVLGLMIGDYLPIVRATQFLDATEELVSSTSVELQSPWAPLTIRTPSALDYKGITYVSWARGEYPWTTSWKAQTYYDSQAITGVSITTGCAHSGVGGLEMTVDLIGSHPNKSSGEVFVDLRYHPPLLEPPCCLTVPVNFDGVQICAYVRCPAGSRGDPNRPNGLQMFVKDESWRSFYGDWYNIQENGWNHICVTPDTIASPLGYMDPGFDPTRIVLLGVKVGAGGGSTATFSGLMCLDDVGWTADGCNPAYTFENIKNSLDELKRTGANYVALIDTWYMDHPTSTVIYQDPVKTHTDDEITRTIQEIHNRQMGVLLKPHIDVQDGTWRGNISPSDPVAWCNSYTSFITHFAEIAQNTGVELFSVGTELESTYGSQYYPCWDTVINAVRGIYTGTLTYAANWDNHKNVPFWDRIDIVGIDAYFPLSDARDPSLPELIDGWRPWIAQIGNWQATIGKPILFTEIGYRNVDYCAKAPWNFDDERLPNCQCQARAYEAALIAWACKPWFHVMFWWNWFPWSDAGGCCETSFTPQNKPAQQVLSSFDDACLYLPLVTKNYQAPTPSPTPTVTPTSPPDCGRFPDSPDGRYRAKVVYSDTGVHYQVIEINTGRVILTTYAEYSTYNDVKAGGFGADSKKFAAAYHYGHAGNYTWIGVWSTQTGAFLYYKTKSGWTTSLCGVFDETPTPTVTSTRTPTATGMPTSTQTPTSTPTATPSSTPTRTATPTATRTPTATATLTPTPTPSPTLTPTRTATPTATRTPTATGTPTPTPTDLVIYGDSLAPGWESWSWDTYHLDFQSSACAYSGAGIEVGLNAWGGLGLAYPPGVSMTPYDRLEFHIKGKESGGQLLRVSTNTCIGDCEHPPGGLSLNDPRYITDGTVTTAWKPVSIPLADLGVENTTIYKINIIDNSGSAQPILCVDDVLLRRSTGASP